MYVYGGLNITTLEAQWLEHRLINEGSWDQTPPGVGFSLKVLV